MSRLDALLSADPARRAAERFYLWYTPVWGAAAGLVMLTGLAERWGDGPLLALGLALYGGVLAGGFLFRAPEERAVPWYGTFHARYSLSVGILSFLGNLLGTRYFYEMLGMHYGFHTRWNLNQVPFFLYLLTGVYFTTYGTLLSLAMRWLARRSGAPPGAVRLGALLPASLAVAALETGLNANPFLRHAFCYENLPFMLTFGTLVYGSWFVLVGPVWYRLDEDLAAPRASAGRVALHTLLAFAGIVAVCEVCERWIAPRFTRVVPGAVGMPGLQGPCCLDR